MKEKIKLWIKKEISDYVLFLLVGLFCCIAILLSLMYDFVRLCVGVFGLLKKAAPRMMKSTNKEDES